MSSQSRLQKEIPAMSVLDEVINNCSDLLLDQPLFSDPRLKHWRGYGIFSCLSDSGGAAASSFYHSASQTNEPLLHSILYWSRSILNSFHTAEITRVFDPWCIHGLGGRGGAEGSGWSFEVTLSLPDFVICLVHVLCGASTVRFLSYLAFYRTSFFKQRATQTRFSLNLPFKLCCLSLVLFKMTQLQ